MRQRLLEDDDLDLKSAMDITEMLDGALKNSESCLMKYPPCASTWNDSRTENAWLLDNQDSQLTALQSLLTEKP